MADANGWINSGLQMDRVNFSYKNEHEMEDNRPRCIVNPKHARAFLTKITLGRGNAFLRRISIKDSFIYAFKTALSLDSVCILNQNQRT